MHRCLFFCAALCLWACQQRGGTVKCNCQVVVMLIQVAFWHGSALSGPACLLFCDRCYWSRGRRQGGAHGANCYTIQERQHLHRHFHHCVRLKACAVSEHVTQKEDRLMIMDQEFGLAVGPNPPEIWCWLWLWLWFWLLDGWANQLICARKAPHSHRSRCPLAPAILSSASTSSSDAVKAPGKSWRMSR